MAPERRRLSMTHYTDRIYRGPIKHDFLGESHLVNGRWERQSFTISEKDKQMYRFFGKLHKYPEYIKEAVNWWDEMPVDKKVKPGDKILHRTDKGIRTLGTLIKGGMVFLIAEPFIVEKVEKQKGKIKSVTVSEFEYTDKFKNTWDSLPRDIVINEVLLKNALEKNGCIRKVETNISSTDFRLLSSFKKEFSKRNEVTILEIPQDTFNV
jgi:hypothetical protein